MKENEILKTKIASLIEYIRFLGEIADVCTFRETKEICIGCRCSKGENDKSS